MNRQKARIDRKMPKTFSLKTGAVENFIGICEKMQLDPNDIIGELIHGFNKKNL